MTLPINKPQFAVALLGWDDANGNWVPVKTDSTGVMSSSASLTTGDIEIGAVELKNGVTDQRANINARGALLVESSGTSLKTVAASATDSVLGATGATGDYLSHLIIVPASTSPGAVSIKDGSGSAVTVFAGGTSSVSALQPFAVPVMAVTGSGAWKVTTGANVSVVAVGNFT